MYCWVRYCLPFTFSINIILFILCPEYLHTRNESAVDSNSRYGTGEVEKKKFCSLIHWRVQFRYELYSVYSMAKCLRYPFAWSFTLLDSVEFFSLEINFCVSFLLFFFVPLFCLVEGTHCTTQDHGITTATSAHFFLIQVPFTGHNLTWNCRNPLFNGMESMYATIS